MVRAADHRHHPDRAPTPAGAGGGGSGRASRARGGAAGRPGRRGGRPRARRRGEPERLAELKGGVARLAERFPAVPVIPIFLHGLGKALPRGTALLVPFFCDVFVGEPVPWRGDRKTYVEDLRRRLEELAAEGRLAEWL